MTIIDAHHHLWDRMTDDHSWLEEPSLEPIRADHSLADLRSAAPAEITGTVLVQALATTHETKNLLVLAAKHRFVSGVVGWADLTRPDLSEHLHQLRSELGGHRL